MIKRKRDRLDSMMRRKMPVMVGRMAKDHFQDNFRQGGFVNGGLHPWPKAKRLSSGGSDAASNYGTLLSGRKHLFKSVGYTPADYRVRVFNEVVYAPINNWRCGMRMCSFFFGVSAMFLQNCACGFSSFGLERRLTRFFCPVPVFFLFPEAL